MTLCVCERRGPVSDFLCGSVRGVVVVCRSITILVVVCVRLRCSPLCFVCGYRALLHVIVCVRLRHSPFSSLVFDCRVHSLMSSFACGCDILLFRLLLLIVVFALSCHRLCATALFAYLFTPLRGYHAHASHRLFVSSFDIGVACRSQLVRGAVILAAGASTCHCHCCRATLKSCFFLRAAFGS